MIFAPTFFKENFNRLKSDLPPDSLAVFFSDPAFRDTWQPAYRPYLDRNFFYLTGISDPNLCLMIASGEGPDYLYSLDDQYHHPDFCIRPAQELLEAFWQRIDHGLKTLYIFSYEESPMQEENKLGLLAWRARERNPSIEITNSFHFLKVMRAEKRPCEVAAIEKACSMTGQALEFAFSKMGPVSYEYEIAADLDYYIHRRGSEYSFQMVAAGENTLQLHYLKNRAPIHDGDLVLVDLGVLNHFYTSDISRTYPVGGRFSPIQALVYDLVLEGQKKAEDLIKPGITLRQLTAEVREFLSQGLLDLGLCHSRDEAEAAFPHNIGHPVGLYVHDPWGIDDPIQAGNVYTLEPGLYLKNEGFGIRIEDCYLVEDAGVRCLSSGIPKARRDIEAMTGLGKRYGL